MRAGTILIAGALAQKPRHGGHTWVFLQYILGFRRLGWDVVFLDQLAPEMCVDGAGRPCPFEESLGVRVFLEVMRRFGLEGCYSLGRAGTRDAVGLGRARVLQRARDAALLVNVMGFLRDDEVLGAVPRRVFLDIDPGFGQMWRALGLHDPFRGHDAYVTIAENIGRSGCAIPACGLSWKTTRPPVVRSLWGQTESGDPRGAFTSIASWRGAYGPVDFEGKTYGLRVHEFRRFLPLPSRSGRPFHLALDIHACEADDLARLASNGWMLDDPRAVAGDPWSYRDYIRRSAAEFMVAKNMYVRSESGWFSDRSVCYLACGRPVLAHDTGLRRLYPAGEGLVTFSTLEEALSGVEDIAAHYGRHARAARELAAEYFDSDRVLPRLLENVGVG